MNFKPKKYNPTLKFQSFLKNCTNSLTWFKNSNDAELWRETKSNSCC